MPTLLEAALYYAQMGRPVFPCHYPKDGGCSCMDPGCGSKCKHPLTKSGFLDATTDPGTIRKWWAHWPEANIGMPMGNGWVALDVDAGGDDELLKHDPIPLTPSVRTQSGGEHLILLEHPTVPLVNAARRLPGLDVRTGKGYIIAPPSKGIKGVYKWNVKLNGHFAPCPDWLAEAFRDKVDEERPPAIAPVEISEGGRDETLYRVGCRMRYAGADDQEIATALGIFNKARCKPPLDRQQVSKIARSVAMKPIGSPVDEAPVYEPGELPDGVKTGRLGELAGDFIETGVGCGLAVIDDNTKMRGLPDGQVSIVSAYTGFGKTALMLQMADFIASQGITVCWASYADMNATRLRNRLLTMRTGWNRSVPPTEGDFEFERWHDAKSDINKLPIEVWDATTSPKGRFLDPFLAWLKQKSVGAVFVDYAQKVKSSNTKISPGDRMTHAMECCEALESEAEKYMVPFVLGSQITLGNAKEGTPAITKGSRDWEESAGIHLMIRVFEGKDLEKLDQEFRGIPGIGEFRLVKNRHGKGRISVYTTWSDSMLRFTEL